MSDGYCKGCRMSEKIETIEERYEEIVRMFGVWRGSGDITTAGREFIAVFLNDLMAEREKLLKKINELADHNLATAQDVETCRRGVDRGDRRSPHRP